MINHFFLESVMSFFDTRLFQLRCFTSRSFSVFSLSYCFLKVQLSQNRSFSYLFLLHSTSFFLDILTLISRIQQKPCTKDVQICIPSLEWSNLVFLICSLSINVPQEPQLRILRTSLRWIHLSKSSLPYSVPCNWGFDLHRALIPPSN